MGIKVQIHKNKGQQNILLEKKQKENKLLEQTNKIY